jgi:hypothetical protein
MTDCEWPGSAHYNVDAGTQFVLMEWLCHIIVGTDAKGFDLHFDDGVPRQDEHWRSHFRHPKRSHAASRADRIEAFAPARYRLSFASTGNSR